MAQDARKGSPGVRGYALVLAYSASLIFGGFLLANSLGIRYYHFYALEVVKIVVFSPIYDLLVWLVATAFVAAEALARLVLSQRELERTSAQRWAAIPHLLLIASFALFLLDGAIAAAISPLLGFAAVVASIYHGKGALFVSRRGAAAMVAACCAFLLIPIALASLGSWVSNAFSYEFPFGPGLRWVFPKLDLAIFSILYPLTPFLLLVVLLCWLWVPLSGRLPRRWRRFLPEMVASPAPPSKIIQAITLIVSSALAGFVAYYPYIRLPAGYMTGVDAAHYCGFLDGMINKGLLAGIIPDRPLFMLMLYAIKSVTSQPAEIIVRFMPVACAVAFVLATFWLVRTGTKDAGLALLTSALAAFSFQITAGMMGYFLANWLAMAGIFAFFALLLRSMEGGGMRYSVLAGVVSILVLGTHPYSWVMMAAVLAAYAAATAIVRRRVGKEVLYMAVPMLMTAAAAVPLLVYTGLGPKGLAYVADVVSYLWRTLVGSLNPSKLALLIQSLAHMADRWVGGAFGSPIVYVLALAGVATMRDLSKNFNRLILCWVLVPALVLFAVIPGSEAYYYRIAYTIPFQIPAAIGAYWLLGRMSEWLRGWRRGGAALPDMPFYTKCLLGGSFLLLALILFNYALRIVDQLMVEAL